MKNKILLPIILLIGAIVLSSCGTKTAINAEQFKSELKEKKFTIQDVTNQFAGADTVESVIVASSPEGYQIELFVLKDAGAAQQIFNLNQANFEQEKPESSSNSKASGKNFSKYEQTCNESYYCISRIDNTMIYLRVPEKNKDEVKDILKDLGY
jgi:hypothetical protein